jgi:hypothetical protein
MTAGGAGAGGAASAASSSSTTASSSSTSSSSTTASSSSTTSSSTTASSSASSSSTTASSSTSSSTTTASSSSTTSSSTTASSSTTSSSTTASSSSTSSSSTTASSSSGATTGPVTCNGLCGQPGCEAFTCADQPPGGWTGPFQLYRGPTAQAPACPAAATSNVLSAHLDPRQDPAQCSACTVGAPYGEWCFATAAAHPDGACGGDPGSVFFGLGFCNGLGSNDYASAVGTDAPQAVYYCDASPQTPTVPPLEWNTAVVGCGVPTPAANGCSPSQRCLPPPQAPFGARLCVSKSGDVACPVLTYTARTLVYTGALDQRTCTPCGYSRSDITCTGTAVLYADGACGAAIGSVTDFSGACLGLPGTVGSAELVGATFTGTPSCAPTGGQPAGAVTPSGAVTVCCAP